MKQVDPVYGEELERPFLALGRNLAGAWTVKIAEPGEGDSSNWPTLGTFHDRENAVSFMATQGRKKEA